MRPCRPTRAVTRVLHMIPGSTLTAQGMTLICHINFIKIYLHETNLLLFDDSVAHDGFCAGNSAETGRHQACHPDNEDGGY